MLHQLDINDEFERIQLNNPFDCWNTWYYKELLATATTDWLVKKANWATMLTFTYKDEVTFDYAHRSLRYWIRVCNEKEFGNHYTRKVGHSYFSYVAGLETQTRGVYHWHVVIDTPIEFSFVHWFWNLKHGYVWIRPVEDAESAIRYSIKYATKEGELLVYLRS